MRAVTKAQAYAEHTQHSEKTPISSEPKASKPEDECLFLKVEYQLVRVAYNDIRYIQGLKDYVKVHLQSSSRPLLSLINMKALEEKLPSQRFMRIHRSYIISLDKIEAVSRGNVQVGNESIPVSNQYKDQFNEWINRWTG